MARTPSPNSVSHGATPTKTRRPKGRADRSGPAPLKRTCKPNACLSCKKSHVDCGGNLPGTSACKHCTKKGLNCEYGKDERTNASKKDELLRRIQNFKNICNDYYNACFCLSLNNLSHPEHLAGPIKVAKEQFSIITPKQFSQILKTLMSPKWSFLVSPAYPQFCTAAEAKAQDGVKLNDTRKAIVSFHRDAVDYIQKMHLVYGILASQLPEIKDAVNYIHNTAGHNQGFHANNFAYLEGLGYNAQGFVTAEVKAYIEKELNEASPSPASVAAPVPSLAHPRTRDHIDLTNEQEQSSQGSSAESLLVSSPILGSIQGLIPEPPVEPTHQAPLPQAIPAVSHNTGPGPNIAGFANWADPGADPAMPTMTTPVPVDPSFAVAAPYNHQHMWNLQQQSFEDMLNEPVSFDWPAPPTAEAPVIPDDNGSNHGQWTTSAYYPHQGI